MGSFLGLLWLLREERLWVNDGLLLRLLVRKRRKLLRRSEEVLEYHLLVTLQEAMLDARDVLW